MILPNKVIPLSESAVGKAVEILKYGPGRRDLIELYHEVADKFESIDQFLLALDVLYVLGRVEMNFDSEELIYAA